MLHADGPAVAPEVKLSDLGHRERQDLQEWILGDPGMLEDGLLVLTSEFDRWTSSDGLAVKDRLDVLAVDQTGRLVVIELKRDDAPTDVHLQAITYAAMVSRFSEEQIIGIHTDFLRRRGQIVSAGEAQERIQQHLDSEIEPQVLKQVRLILVARRFPRQVTSSAVWLNEMGIDVKLVLVRAWDADGVTVLTTSTLYPVPGTEEFTVVPARVESAKAAERASERVRQRNTTARIVELGALRDGELLTIRPREVGPQIRAAIDEWLIQDQSRGRVTWVGDPSKPLLWEHDRKQYAPTTLVKEIIEQVTGSRPEAVRGPRWWVDKQGLDLFEIAEAADTRGV